MFHHFRITTKLFVSKLPDTVRKIDLQKLCEQYGTVVECDFVKKYAFVVNTESLYFIMNVLIESNSFECDKVYVVLFAHLVLGC